ncbi:MAG: Transcriptional repressor of the xylose operon, partial [Candidatus Falkowbacteria bacterium GW2011_GWF2_39_8]
SFNELGTILGIRFANIANLIDPEIIIVGGGATRSSDLFLPRAKKIFKQTVVNPKAKEIKIVTGKLGELSGAIGAALLI